ncbi:MAG: hypothetical protein LBM70_10070 [Victivallales bacterium]|nr:hypothetical protein [Victivallales bacterium]
MFLRIFILPFNLLLVLAVIGVWRYRKNQAILGVFVLSVLYAGSLLFFTMFYRFRIPDVPLMALLAGTGVAALNDWWKKRDIRTLMIVVISSPLFLYYSSVSPDSRRRFNERATVARLLIENRRFGEAESYLEKMAQDGHDVRAGAFLLIQRLISTGDSVWAQTVAERFFGTRSTQK